MNDPQPFSETRATVRLRANLRAGAFAVALATLPELIIFAQVGDFTRRAWIGLARALTVAGLMVAYQHIERLSKNDDNRSARVRWLFGRAGTNGRPASRPKSGAPFTAPGHAESQTRADDLRRRRSKHPDQ